jgi:hypothetical protein
MDCGRGRFDMAHCKFALTRMRFQRRLPCARGVSATGGMRQVAAPFRHEVDVERLHHCPILSARDAALSSGRTLWQAIVIVQLGDRPVNANFHGSNNG